MKTIEQPNTGLSLEDLEREEEDLMASVLKMKLVISNLINGMADGTVKTSSSLIQQSTGAIKMLSILLANAKIDMKRKQAEEEAEANLIDGCSPEEASLLDEWESEGETKTTLPEDLKAKEFEVDDTDTTKMLARWQNKARGEL